MCSIACLWAGISRIVYGAGRDDVNSVYFESRHFDTADFIRQAFRNYTEIEGGLLSEECSSLYIHKEEPQPTDPAYKATRPAV
jgi:tRNA(adenine34) deaminase